MDEPSLADAFRTVGLAMDARLKEMEHRVEMRTQAQLDEHKRSIAEQITSMRDEVHEIHDEVDGLRGEVRNALNGKGK